MDKNSVFGRKSDTIYVTGHINPDTDSIAAAIGYAWLLGERDGSNAVASRAGSINPQTAYVLKWLEIDPPLLVTDASPRFESVMRRLDAVSPDRSLNEAWTILSRTGGIAPVVNLDGTPYGMVTGKSMFDFLRKIIGPHAKLREMTIAELMDIPCREQQTRIFPGSCPKRALKM